MLVGVYILVDDEYDAPIYADPSPAELDDGVWPMVCEVVQDVLDAEREVRGTVVVGESLIAWRALLKTGITFVAVVTDDVKPQQVEVYLSKLARRYADEVDDWRTPDKAGVSDVVVDVIPPWEEDDG
ncbi:MAG: hypothetical protein ABMA64_13910 [Myxococcota bacterium]